MNALWFKCTACASDNDIPFPKEAEGLLREQILPRCQCRKCGCVGASDMRRYYEPGVNALDGAKTGRE